MSRTRRKDQIDCAKKPKTFMFMGKLLDLTPSPKERRKAHADGKKWNKPGSDFKAAQRKKDSRKPIQALREAVAQGKDFDDIVLPDAKKHDQWDYL